MSVANGTTVPAVPGAITVAAVDDHPIVLRGLADLLHDVEDFRLIGTAHSIEALLAGPGRGAQVILLDLDLGDGTAPPHNIQRLLAVDRAVVVFSAAAAPATVRDAMRAGASGFVPKTDDIEDLATAIRAAAAGTGWISPQLAFLLLTDDATDKPDLSPKEVEALRLYATGMPMKTVAHKMNVSPETAKQYIDRVRSKYRKAGRDASTKVDLYKLAVEDGHLNPGAEGTA
ncbi:LuxR family transcriptional regulator [Frankia sp. CcI156]|jgi:DNA-binding NarL/FixJ family response regulator|uniref:Two component transcriptional regulator, LuxR family n=2 Tax=Frankia casuarinae (strain DSM 45818 / CECT 9043 / HFP020203 / CcI3) TaxID=106370 RepID=Q2JCD6_FRACC|nr:MULTISPECIES: response regulator transcription factor [Frankia]ABD11056.1 two component transcriptional regulator, LuxR family [Frankia casuarinae]ETA00932.1 two component transcriptional regulator, LuxR family [Frankia sp. CcI6]EYT91040.1 two component transcriptional regulator, LuxR family [Frankia casuarinae]KDA41922.1 two component transcriptional regulator, LuxR family [Frankia sp. BMG5.23]KEZ37422.1 two component transcriptional regulator, LuxR family [Frankia sp. CeD]